MYHLKGVVRRDGERGMGEMRKGRRMQRRKCIGNFERKRDTEVKKGQVKLGKEGGGPGKGNWGEKGQETKREEIKEGS